MRFTQTLASAAALLASAEATILGFNSGSTLATYQGKVLSDYEAEFSTAQKLQGAPGTFNSVRLYTMIQAGTTNTPISAFQAAIDTNTTMLLGIWCSGTTTIQNELDALSSAISTYGSKFTDLVIGISVGSEDLYRISVSGVKNQAGVGNGPDSIVNFIKQTRSAIASTPLSSKPVGHVETWNDWTNSSNKAVLDNSDFLGMDLYPYYEAGYGNDITNAVSLFETAYNAVTGVSGSKPVWITETGWPTSGPTVDLAVASVSNAQYYWDNVGCKYFASTNVWWYNLRDSNPANVAKFAISPSLSSTPAFNLTCPTVSKSTSSSSASKNATSSTKSGSSSKTSGSASKISGSASNSSGFASATGSGSSASASISAGNAATATPAGGSSGASSTAGASGSVASSNDGTAVRSAGAVLGATLFVLLGMATL